MVDLWGVEIDNCNVCMRRSVQERDLDAAVIAVSRGWGEVSTKFVGVDDGDGVGGNGGTIPMGGEIFDENG